MILRIILTFSRKGLLDPRWREQQQKSVEEKKIQDEIFAEGMQIDSSLKYLAERTY